MLESFATVAVNGCAVLTCTEAEDRDSETLIAGGGAAVTVSVAEADFAGSATLVALSVTVAGFGTVGGAV